MFETMNHQPPPAATVQPTAVKVTVSVDVAGANKTFTARAETNTDGWDVAYGLLLGLRNDAGDWVNDRHREAGEAARR